MSSPWALIEKQQYQAAIDEYSLLISSTGSARYIFGRGFARFLNKDYESALEDYLTALEASDSERRSASNFINLGICYWYLDLPIKAVSAFRQSASAIYTDAAGGVIPTTIMLYAAERLNDDVLLRESLSIIDELWTNHQRRQKRRYARNNKPSHSDFVHQGLSGWPGPIVPYLLQKIDDAELEEVVKKSTGNTTLLSRRQCQADFSAGVLALRKGDDRRFRLAMKACASSEKGIHEKVYFLAKWEEAHDFPQPAFQDYTP